MEKVFTSWKTTLGGVILALAQVLPQFGIATEVASILSSVGALLLGLGAKDNNVTGGTKQQ